MIPNRENDTAMRRVRTPAIRTAYASVAITWITNVSPHMTKAGCPCCRREVGKNRSLPEYPRPVCRRSWLTDRVTGIGRVKPDAIHMRSVNFVRLRSAARDPSLTFNDSTHAVSSQGIPVVWITFSRSLGLRRSLIVGGRKVLAYLPDAFFAQRGVQALRRYTDQGCSLTTRRGCIRW
jgi:hypothetical protein